MKNLATVILLAASFAACGSDSSTSNTESCPSRVPVLFVHGSGLSSDSWGDALAALQQAGYPRQFLKAIDIVPSDADNLVAAKHISAEVERLLQDGCPPPKAKVDIVAHSMGAISSRWFAARIAPERVRTLITIAGSNHGTDALCNIDGTGNRQMCPAYATKPGIQRMLNGSQDVPADETPFGVGRDTPDIISVPPDDERRIVYLTIRIDPDEWIDPARSAELVGSGGVALAPASCNKCTETSPGNFRLDKPAAHDSLPYDPDVIDFLLAALSRHTD